MPQHITSLCLVRGQNEKVTCELDLATVRLGHSSSPSRELGSGFAIHLFFATFCDYVEVKTRSWAIIQGATAFKFGIYFGKTKSDRTQKYRFTGKFGTTEEGAFAAVKQALLDLVQKGAENTPDFSALDENPLSQMFKPRFSACIFRNAF